MGELRNLRRNKGLGRKFSDGVIEFCKRSRYFWSMKKFALASVLCLVAGNLTVTPAMAASTPKVGDCFFISPEELDSSNPISSKISCNFTHNLETYFVGKLSGTIDPNTQSDSALLTRVKQSCLNNWRFPSSSPLNYFAFYVPTSAQWRNGTKWLRCDGGIDNSGGGGGTQLGTWKGSAIAAKGNITPLS